ncbi:hypothetical protein ACFY36_25755 [Actinoplanes sp. NPDC000266]
MSDLWTREMAGVKEEFARWSEAERIRVMCEAIDYAMFRSLTPLAAIPSPGARALIDEALAAGRSGAKAETAYEISGRMYPSLDFEGSVGSLQRQAMGRRITIEHELGNPACLDIIRAQKELLSPR